MVAARIAVTEPDWPALSEAHHAAEASGELDTYRRRRWSRAGEWRGWLEQDTLPELTEDQAVTLYRGAGGRQISNFRANPIEDVRETVDFLLYDAIKLENRFEECAVETGGFGLRGAGKELPSYLLALWDPTLFAPWSPHTERALRRLRMLPAGFSKGHPGLCYIDLLDILGNLARRLQVPDFRCVDEFCYLNGRNRKPQAR